MVLVPSFFSCPFSTEKLGCGQIFDVHLTPFIFTHYSFWISQVCFCLYHANKTAQIPRGRLWMSFYVLKFFFLFSMTLTCFFFFFFYHDVKGSWQKYLLFFLYLSTQPVGSQLYVPQIFFFLKDIFSSDFFFCPIL